MKWLDRFARGRASRAGTGGATRPAEAAAQVIVYAHGSPEAIHACLSAALESFPGRDFFLVQDTKDAGAGEYLARFAAEHACTLIQNLDVLGFRRSVIKALRVSSAEVVAVVDSDVSVTTGGLRELAEELAAEPAADLAVGWLDVQLRGRLASSPAGGDAELVAAALESHGIPGTADVTLAAFSGHPCFAIRRSTLSKLASWEAPRREEGLEECEAGSHWFHLRTVPGCYATTYGNNGVPEIFRPALAAVDSGLSPGVVDAAVDVLMDVSRVREVLREQVLFLLPSPGGTGGAHSVVQEVAGLRRCGLDARIANRASNRRAFEQHYPEADGFCFYYADEHDLLEMACGAAIVVATNHTSVESLKTVVDRHAAAVPLYYVQDYEPWFYSEQDPRHAAAKASYHFAPNQTVFAKTQWLRDTIHQLVGIDVARIEPGLDRTLYNGLTAFRGGTRLGAAPHPVTIAAMIRPDSPRRNPTGTLNVLRRIEQTHRTAVDIRVFGCGDEELDLLDEAAGFRFVNLGELRRWEVAAVLRGAGIFVDLSTFQAFGCTGLEAMATGCATVLPRGSGVEEYAVDGRNCLLVDAADEEEAVAAVEQLMTDSELMLRIRREALKTGRKHSVRRAAWSQLRLFADVLEVNRVSRARGIAVAR